MQLPLGVCILLVVAGGRAATEASLRGDRESQIRAALVFKVARFVTWPESSFSSPDGFHFCFVGDVAMERALSGIEGRLIQRRGVRLRRLDDADRLAPGECNLLYLGKRKGLDPETFSLALESSMLIIADESLSGAMVALIQRDNRMRLAIDLGNVRAAQLRVDAPLLQMVEVRK